MANHSQGLQKGGEHIAPKNLKKARRKARQQRNAFVALDEKGQRETVKNNKQMFIVQRDLAQKKYDELLLEAVQATSPSLAISSLERAVRMRSRIDVYNVAIALADKNHMGLIPKKQKPEAKSA